VDIRLRAGNEADLTLLLDLDLDASTAFERVGMFLDLPETHEFPVRERERFRKSLVAGWAVIAEDTAGLALGFIALGEIDARPYVEQLSVRVSHARRGIGTMLLDHAWTMPVLERAHDLWLTTYDHLPWNRPFYERNGFVVVPEHRCGPGIRNELEFQRKWLPEPAHRVAMRRVRS
jgi:GNAT superfamily N-acetyltransferase